MRAVDVNDTLTLSQSELIRHNGARDGAVIEESAVCRLRPTSGYVSVTDDVSDVESEMAKLSAKVDRYLSRLSSSGGGGRSARVRDGPSRCLEAVATPGATDGEDAGLTVNRSPYQHVTLRQRGPSTPWHADVDNRRIADPLRYQDNVVQQPSARADLHTKRHSDDDVLSFAEGDDLIPSQQLSDRLADTIKLDRKLKPRMETEVKADRCLLSPADFKINTVGDNSVKLNERKVQADRCLVTPVYSGAAKIDFRDGIISDVRSRKTAVNDDGRCGQYKRVATKSVDNTEQERRRDSDQPTTPGAVPGCQRRRAVQPDAVLSRRRGSRLPVISDPSDSNSDDERRSAGRSKRRWIRPPTFDGTTQSFAAFKAQFDNAAVFNRWRDDEQLAHLKSCLVSVAAQTLWDTPAEQTDSLSKLWKLLENRYGGRNVAERYRTELRARRRRSGESLNVLFLDIKRLVAMGYQSEPASSTVLDSVAKDCFIDALSSDLALRVREKEPATLEDALHVALRLEAIYNTSTPVQTDDDNRGRNKMARGTTAPDDRRDSDAEVVLYKLSEMQARFDNKMKELNTRMSQMEAAHRVGATSSDGHVAAGSFPSSRTWTAAARQPSQPVQAESTRPTSTSSNTDKPPPRWGNSGCFRCGDRSHRVRDCPFPPNRPSNSTAGDNSLPSPTSSDAAGKSDAAKSRGVSHPAGDGYVYLAVSVYGRSFLALVDSGCELNLAPPSVLRDERLSPVTQCVFAANGTPIEISGRAEIPIKIGDRVLPTDVLISPDVAEIMLSYQWLHNKRCVWDFSKHVLHVEGHPVSLCDKKQSSAAVCRRVYVQDDVVIPPRHQVSVPARSTLDSLRVNNSDEWVVEPKQIRPGVLLARTLLPDRHRDIVVRVVNTTDEPQKLPRNLCLGESTQVEQLLDGLNSFTPKPDSDPDTPEKNEAKTKPFVGDECEPVADLIDALPSELTENERAKAIELLKRHESVFSRGEFDVGRTDLICHRINTGSHAPVRQPLRRHPTAYLETIDDYIDQLQANDIIEPSSGPWAANVVCVKRKDGRLRLCCDFRGVNARTYHDSWPLPNIEATFDTLTGCRFFSSCDLRAGYHNIPVHEDDRDKTQIITRRGTWRWKLMPFGLSTSPSTCQRLMDLVFSGLTYQSVLTFLDDILVFGQTFDELIERMDVVFSRLRAAKLKLHTKKCHLFRRRVEFLGHVISEDGIAVQKDKTDAITEWPTPVNGSELRSFLGLAGYYRRFVPSFSIIAAPLFELTRKGHKFDWTGAQQRAFDELKQRLTTTPILSAPTPNGVFSVSVDASGEGLGVVVEQKQNDVNRVIAYASRTLTASERNYCTTRRELLAVVFALKKFRHYLLGRHFIVKTDHASLQWLRKTPEPISQAARWLALIEEFDFEVQHVAGARHQHADALSRRPCRQCGRNEFENEEVSAQPELNVQNCDVFACRAGRVSDPDYRPGSGTSAQPPPTDESPNVDSVWRVRSPAELAELQRTCPDIGTIVRLRFEFDEQPPFDEVRGQSENTKFYWTLWSQLIVCNNVVYRVVFDRNGRPNGRQLLTPIAIREELMECVHRGLTGSHVGLARTTHQVSRRAWWRGWRADVRRFYKRCSRCNRYFRGTLPRRGPLQPTRVGDIFERISIDLTGPHCRSRRGNVYILTVVDSFSKWAEAFAIRNKEAETVARTLVEHVYCRFGCPLELLSDNGLEVHGTIMKEVCRLLQIDKLNTSVYKPSTNATCERFHRTLNTLMGKVVSDRQVDWDDHLPYVMAALRSSVHESTGYSPNYLMLHREVRSPADLVYGLAESSDPTSYDDYVETVRDHMRAAYDLVREHLGVAAERNKRYYDAKVRPIPYAEGDRVYYYNPRKYAGRSDKWARKFLPCTVLKILTPVTVLLQRSKNSKAFVSHVDKIKPCYEDESATHKETVVTRGAPLPTLLNLSDKDGLKRNSRVVRPPVRLIEKC